MNSVVNQTQAQTPLVSIIITNYNYARYLPAAIESALQQEYQPIEIIVVDDGSTDNSHAVLATYGDQIKVIYKTNGGQGSAFNAGFEQCSGDYVIFLDADDLLLPHIVKLCVETFQSNANVVMVRHYLKWMDEHGETKGPLKPSRNVKMLSGDIRQQVISAPNDIFWQSASGNAFPAWVLHKIFPVPPDEYRNGADEYVIMTTSLFGEVVSLNNVGGQYRVHGSNLSKIGVKRLRVLIKRFSMTDRHIQRFAQELGLHYPTKDIMREISHYRLAIRLASLKLDPEGHPIEQDTVFKLTFAGLRNLIRHATLPLYLKIVYIVWFIAMALAPKRWAAWLTEWYYAPVSRTRITSFFETFSPKQSRPSKLQETVRP